jgi:hypothetical protein
MPLLLGCAAATPRGEPPRAEQPRAEPRRAAPLRLSFLADYNPPRPQFSSSAPTASWDQALGGLSGLWYSERESLLYAVSDDPHRFPHRLYTFRVRLSAGELEVSPHSVIPLREQAPSGTLIDLDAESITSDGRGSLWLGTENADEHPTQRWPRILRANASGGLDGALALPEELLPEQSGTPTRGTRTNLAFEGLSLSPSGRWLTASTEASLRQDGPLASFEQGTLTRVLQWDLHAPGAPPRQFRYLTEPVPRPAGGEASRVLLNGVSELLYLDDERLLVLERAYVAPPEGHGVNNIRIFEISLPPPPASAPEAPLSKRLLLDLDSVLSQLEPGQQSLDNFEGMTLGPRLPSGARSLLLVTDDNFREEQRTLFLALQLDGQQPPE